MTRSGESVPGYVVYLGNLTRLKNGVRCTAERGTDVDGNDEAAFAASIGRSCNGFLGQHERRSSGADDGGSVKAKRNGAVGPNPDASCNGDRFRLPSRKNPPCPHALSFRLRLAKIWSTTGHTQSKGCPNLSSRKRWKWCRTAAAHSTRDRPPHRRGNPAHI